MLVTSTQSQNDKDRPVNGYEYKFEDLEANPETTEDNFQDFDWSGDVEEQILEGAERTEELDQDWDIEENPEEAHIAAGYYVEQRLGGGMSLLTDMLGISQHNLGIYTSEELDALIHMAMMMNDIQSRSSANSAFKLSTEEKHMIDISSKIIDALDNLGLGGDMKGKFTNDLPI